MTTGAPAHDIAGNASLCWCCGTAGDPSGMVHLGNHPEVALCTRCARWTALRAREIEDQGRSGWPVLARNRLRAVRRAVIDRGWHHNTIIGRPIRWIGKRLPW